MSYFGGSSPIAITGRNSSSTSSSPAWSPLDELSAYPSTSSSRPSSASSNNSSCAFPAWHAFGTTSRRSSSASSYISDDELAIEDPASGSDDDFLPDYQIRRTLTASKHHYRNQPARASPDADDVEVLQRILAAGFTLADPAADRDEEASRKKSPSGSSNKKKTSRRTSARRSSQRSNAMTTILEVGE